MLLECLRKMTEYTLNKLCPNFIKAWQFSPLANIWLHSLQNAFMSTYCKFWCISEVYLKFSQSNTMGVSLAFKSLTKLRDMMDLAGMTLASGWVYIARPHSTYAILSLIRYDWHIRDDYKGDFHVWALHFTWPIGALLMTSQFNVQRWWWRHNRPAIVTCTQINSLDIKNNAWVTVNNDILVTSGVICQWFSRVTKSRVKIIGKSHHEWRKNRYSR